MDGTCMKLMARPLSSLSTCAYLIALAGVKHYIHLKKMNLSDIVGRLIFAVARQNCLLDILLCTPPRSVLCVLCLLAHVSMLIC